jgi:glucose/arabinose dehydrogenase
MQRTILLSLTTAVVLSFTISEFKNKEEFKVETKENSIPIQNEDLGKAAIHYKTYCGGCHGEKMDAFVDRRWKHGKTREDIYKSLTNGYAEAGMPSFKQAFSEKEAYDLADYILEGIKNVDKYTGKTKLTSNIFKTEKLTIRLDTVYKGKNIPWSIAFLPNEELLITDRSGVLTKVLKDKTQQEISGVPEVLDRGQGGLLEVILHPEFSKNKYIYLSYSKVKNENGKKLATTAVLRAKLEGNKLTEQKDIFVALPYSTTQHHYGGRMVFDKKGYLFISVGERGNEKQNPQELTNNSLGKIHRIKDDGSIPADNPFVKNKDIPSSIYTYGNRNPQGLAIDPATQILWEHEHGPRGGDELNTVESGKNYGWPVISYGINYNGSTFTALTAKEGMEQPLHYWIPSIAPSGMAFLKGNIYKGWEKNLMIGSLRFEYLNRCVWENNKIVHEEILFKSIGRVRDVKQGPDGYLYMAVENPGIVYKLVPVK